MRAPQDPRDINEPRNEELTFIAKWITLLLAVFQTRFFLTNRALNWLLKFFCILFSFLGKYSPVMSEIASLLPQTLYKHNFLLTDGNHFTMFERRAVCKSCNTLYELKDCLRKAGTVVIGINRCTLKPFTRTCNAYLMKEIITSNGHRKYYPHKFFCYRSLVSSLQELVMRNGFIAQCESTRNNFSSSGFSDVFDGAIWKDFLKVDDVPYLSENNNYGLLLNVDWIQPFKHITYSVGIVYLVVLNLPRSIRFKRENVILFGIIPGPCEPSLTINTFLDPLVCDLLELWKGVQLQLPGCGETALFRCALLGVACDLPAARKVCGFLSFSANLGCSRCFEKFGRGFSRKNYYGNFERDNWEMRSNSRHRSDVNKLFKCTTKTQRDKKEIELGCRYSSLLKLSYFRPVEMVLIDPMHNLFLGTAKYFARDLWIGRNMLGSSLLDTIGDRLRRSIVPYGLGRLPVSINSGVFLTAEQWKTWTLYFSIFCLGDLIPKPHLECWRHFVLACRKICKYSVTRDDLTIADALLLQFCKKSVQLYGGEAITPNMHMHCHLISCLREFGPAHSFWLFPFERYNGIMEAQPTNNRSIELQLMQRFQRDNFHLHLHHEAKNWPNAEHFLQALPDPPCDDKQLTSANQSVVPGHRSVIATLSKDEIRILSKLYSKMYPQYANLFLEGKISLSTTFRKYCSIVWKGKTIHSKLNKNTQNPFIFASSPFPFTTSNPIELGGPHDRLAEIEFFLIHSAVLPNSDEPISHLLACANWPMIHPHWLHFGKPVEVYCYNLNEPCPVNTFFLASSIQTRAIICKETLLSETVLIAIPLVE